MKIVTLMLLILATANQLKAYEPSPVVSVDTLDFQRYSGLWYEIARLPNKFQRDCAGNVTAEYIIKPDSKIRVVNRCRKSDSSYIEAEGIAKKAKDNGPDSQLKVRFAPSWLSWLSAVWGDYWVIDLASDYSYAAVGEPSRKYLWILARQPELAETTLESILARLQAMGYETGKLTYTSQEQNR